MRKRMFIFLLAMAGVVGVFFLLNALPVGISNNAYATPDKGKTCSRCHGKDVPRGFKGFTDNFMMEKCDGFSSQGRNPYFVLEPGFQLTYDGKEKKHNLHLTITVLDETRLFSGLDIGGG
jgi:hypothetical protein